jgi:glycosyltransferase involved in cell wall biosynthesis
MTQTLCFFIGSHTAFNIQRLSRNLGTMLAPQFDLHLVTTDGESLHDEVKELYDVFGTEHPETVLGDGRSLQRYLSDHDPSVVTQLTDPPRHGTIVGALTSLHGVPGVYRYSGDRFGVYRGHTLPDRALYYGYNNVFGRLPLRLTDRYIALGSHGREQLETRGVPSDRIQELPPVISRDLFAPDTPPMDLPDVPDDRKVALFVGRLTKMKGIETLERAIPRIVDRRPDLHFVLAGPPTQQLDLTAESRDHVTILGAVPPKEMPRLYTNADVLVHPSLTEGLPLVLIEALLSGVPVVARSVGDIPDVTDNTFTAEHTLIDMLIDLESLPLDDGERYTCQSLAPAYTSFYRLFAEPNQ